MSEWKEYKLGEIAEIQNGYAFKSSEFAENGVPIIKIKNIVPPRVVLDDVQFYNNDITTKLEKFVVKKKDFLISMTGSTVNQMASAVGKMARYGFSKPSLMNQRVAKIYSTSEKVIDDYLFYYLNRFDVQFELASSASGSANQANISPEQLKSYLVKVPDIKTQRGIAEILSSIDDKIELNNKINQELESLAQLLFKRWFVDFEFPNENGEPYKSSGGEMVDSEMGEIPKGWNVNIIESLTLKMNSGGTPSTRRNDFYDGNIKWFSTKELQDGFLFESDRKITIEGLNNSSAKLFPSKTVVMAIYAAPTVGRVGILSEEAAFNQAALGFVAKEEVGYEFIYLLLKLLRDDLNNLANGAAQQNLNVGLVKNFKIIYPINKVLSSFQSIIRPIFKYLYQNQVESNSLIKTRDTLLPVLISGELQINEN